MVMPPTRSPLLRRRALGLVTALGLSACAPFPEPPLPEGPPGDYPRLVPIDSLLAQADAPSP
jgi:hypothetical protein